MDIIEQLQNLNWQTIIAMFAIGWYFTRDIRITLHKLDTDVRAQGARTDKLYEMFVSMQKEMKDELKTMQKEMKDELKQFHGRVSVVETRIDGKK